MASQPTKTGKNYTWEGRFQRSWDRIEEDAAGRLVTTRQGDADGSAPLSRAELLRRQRHEREQQGLVRRGLIRCLVVCIDLSRAMGQAQKDMHPSREAAVLVATCRFLEQFFDQNPISQCAVVCTRNGVTKTLSRLSSSLRAHQQALRHDIETHGCGGEASVQNCLESAHKILAGIPGYGTREVLVVFGSLSTCDPGDVFKTVEQLKTSKVRCSVVGMGAEVHILSHAAAATGGQYRVAMNEDHLQGLLEEHIAPLATEAKDPDEEASSAAIIQMGFPRLIAMRPGEPGRRTLNDLVVRRTGYECPQCKSWLSEVPTECVLCGLMLVLSPQLARSYHHLFPVAPFARKPIAAPAATPDARPPRCLACRAALDAELFQCSRCLNPFCHLCDTFIHETLHNCPGCGSAPVPH